MLNSEGFITGDDDGKIRAWIIGFNSVPAQPEQLDIIEELTEHSEKSNMLSHRSQQSLHNFQTNSSQQIDHNGYHSRPSISSNHDNSEQFISPKNEDRQKAIVFPKDQNDHSETDNQAQKSRKEQILRDVKSSFKKNSQNLIENQSIKAHLQNNKNDQILIQDTLDDKNYYPESDKNEVFEDDNLDSEAERKNKSEILIRNQMIDLSPQAIHSNEQKRTNCNHLDRQIEFLKTQDDSACCNQDSYYQQYQNNSEQNLNSQEQFEQLIDQNNQQIINQQNVSLSPKDNFSQDQQKSPINQNSKNKVENFTSQQKNQNVVVNNNVPETISPPINNNKVINLNLPPSLLKQIDYSNTFGQKPISTQKNEQNDNELEGESLPIQQTLNLFTQKNHQEQLQLAPQVLNHQSNSQISQKSEDKNIFTQTVSRLINTDNQQLQNNSDVPAHRRLLSNTTHQSEDNSFENINFQTNQIDSAHKSKQRIVDRKDSNEIKEDYQIVNNDQSNSKVGGFSSSSSSNQKYSQDESAKQMMAGSGKFNSFKLNNLPSVLSNHIDESDESIVISQVGQEIKNQQKINATNSQHKIRDMKEPEHNFEQLTKMLNSQENSKKNEKIVTDLQKQVQNFTHHNNLLQRKIDELLNLNTKLQNDKQDSLKECEDLKQEIQEIKKKQPKNEEQERIKDMYIELKNKLMMIDKVKQDIVKHQNVPLLQKKIEDQQKQILDLREQNQQHQKINELFKEDLIKNTEESKLLKERIQQQLQEIQKLKHLEIQTKKRTDQLTEENSQFATLLKEKDNVIENLTQQLKQRDQINFKLTPSASSVNKDNMKNNNYSSPQAQNLATKEVLIDKILQLNSENDKLKNKIQGLEKQIQILTKQVNQYELVIKKNEIDFKDQNQPKEISIAIQKQKQEINTNTNTSDQGSHRKAQSYFDFKQSQENNNKHYEMTINLKRKQNELNDIHNLKPELNTIENIQNQSTKNYFFEDRVQKSPNYQNERSTYSKSNLSMDLGNLFQNNQHKQVDLFDASKTTQQNKKISLEQQLHEITNKQPFYTPNKSTSVSLSQNITNNSFSNNRLQNTSNSNNNNNNNYILNNSSLNNISLTPRALGQTQDSFTYYQTNTSTKFLQIPSQNKFNQQQQLQQYERQSLSPSPQKTANPNFSQTKVTQNNLSINSPQQNSNFFNTVGDNSRISNPTTPQRTITNLIKSNQPYQQQQIISPQPYIKTIIQNPNNYQQQSQQIQKKPIFDQSPQSRTHYGVIKTQNSDEQQNLVIANVTPYNDLKTSGMNSFRPQDKEQDVNSQYYLQNIQKRRLEDQTKPKQRRLIFSNSSLTPPRNSLNTSMQSMGNNMISNNLNVNSSYTTPYPTYDAYQHTNR
ncbi:hypothetical protein TTHERM_00077650 (macronuclear) [Tetrahymena thermophila SB210]|uniref:Uncharacterized protein n=1 Tax=Tetrahymena thermophila (strain SB210) TaxID=312017 RepID=Q23FZ9_TETTS|nr:hypothetical protein TTHERM_00077650 [Tetrahymena thermophila SB210]EAR95461.2 hypothetical protein TTHERM_00077650 [Tetrahymena thermophila SB210]|eukprot:XP_001015706.2 hypothetical protein TTHERM_00077650 [Tetrahymena thermophila SB210]